MSSSSPQAKTSLMEDLRNLLVTGKATTQEEICTALQNAGHPINQSKVSRLLRKIGAVKSKNESGHIVYRLPLEPAPPTLSSDLASLIMEIDANETLIVVYTSPGAAQLLARIFDYHKKKFQILGTIAGDDAIFIAPKSVKKIGEIIQDMNQFFSKTSGSR